ncbi:hypothetical protein HOY80DRAFT_72523 [Tuber brumale]|nr:hypothetical protein HOY80DRAFT_72523 [Tuber brumale]
MLSRHLPRHLPSSLRQFSASSIVPNLHKVPFIGDVIHSDSSTTDFKTRVSAFHKQLSDAKSAKAKSPENAERTGIVKSILYGSKEGQKEEAEMEQSYSKVMARGKYVHAIEFHHVKPDKVEDYVKLVGEVYPAIATDTGNNCHLVGSWKTEVGECDTFVHIWEYQGYAGYHKTFSRLATTPTFAKFQSSLASIIRSRRTDLMQEFSFWPTSPPRSLGGIFELRTYTVLPGHLLEWETHWRRGLRARKNVMEGVGAWFCQIGSLNTVHHLWQFADLRERQVAREQSWGEKGWSDTVHKTVPLIKKMESRILVPMGWSPLS